MNYRVGKPKAPAEIPAEDVELDDDGAEVRVAEVAMGEHGTRLDRLLTRVAPEFSRNHLQTLVEGGRVTVDGVVRTTSSQKLKAGQHVAVELVRPAHELAFTPQPIPLQVLYEDAHVLVLDKPAGLVVHPAAGNWSGTLLNGLLARDPDAAKLPRAGIVHRLDKDTSGLMVVGRSLEAVTALSRDIADRDVNRQYMALAHGVLKPGYQQIDAPIGRDPRVRVRMAVTGTGKEARTEVEQVASRDGFAAVRCKLHTGRTHQIRVHLAHVGHPLVSDDVYGGRRALGMERQALHAARLAFRHPLTRQTLAFEAAPPADFSRAWDEITGG